MQLISEQAGLVFARCGWPQRGAGIRIPASRLRLREYGYRTAVCTHQRRRRPPAGTGLQCKAFAVTTGRRWRAVASSGGAGTCGGGVCHALVRNTRTGVGLGHLDDVLGLRGRNGGGQREEGCMASAGARKCGGYEWPRQVSVTLVHNAMGAVRCPPLTGTDLHLGC